MLLGVAYVELRRTRTARRTVPRETIPSHSISRLLAKYKVVVHFLRWYTRKLESLTVILVLKNQLDSKSRALFCACSGLPPRIACASPIIFFLRSV